MTVQGEVTITLLGHATTKIETPDGKTILIDPFLQANPAVPDEHKRIDKLDLMLITHGHSDHFADAIPVAQQTNPDVIAMVEICGYMSGKGVQNCKGMNKGGTQAWNGHQITMVDAIHSSSIQDGDTIVYAGTAAGFVIRFSNGFTVYHSGDTDIFEGFRFIGSLYKPDVALICIGDYFTMGPRQAAEAIGMLDVSHVIPIHYGTFPVLTGTPEALEAELRARKMDARVYPLKPGESISQSKIV